LRSSALRMRCGLPAAVTAASSALWLGTLFSAAAPAPASLLAFCLVLPAVADCHFGRMCDMCMCCSELELCVCDFNEYTATAIRDTLYTYTLYAPDCSEQAQRTAPPPAQPTSTPCLPTLHSCPCPHFWLRPPHLVFILALIVRRRVRLARCRGAIRYTHYARGGRLDVRRFFGSRFEIPG
jgi:hypothetical protein